MLTMGEYRVVLLASMGCCSVVQYRHTGVDNWQVESQRRSYVRYVKIACMCLVVTPPSSTCVVIFRE